MQLRANAVLAQEHALTWAAELALKGVPKRVSTFIVEPLYSLRDADGKYTRAILVLSDTGKVFGPLQMEGVDYSGPKALREFLNTRAGGSWMAGERELQVAMTDWAPVFDWKEVEKVGRIGWHAEAEAWFFGDGAIDFEGQPVLPDRYDRIRLRVPKGAAHGQLPSALPKDGSSAYPAREYQWRYFQLSDRDRDGMPFEFGQLNMHLTEKVDGEEVRELFCEMCRRMYLSVGGLDAFMGLGIVLAFSAAPEVFHHLKFFPGVWIHGKAQQGKSVYGGWLAMLYGINTIKNLNVSTGAGAEMCFGQYSNIPLLLDEAQTGMNPAVADMLMSAFNRGTSAKRVERKRDISTNAIVQGVATGHNGQLKSRFPHVLMSKENRLPMPGQVRLDAEGHPMVRDGQQVYWDELSAAEEQARNYERMKELQDSFWKITRWALEHRREFALAAVAAVKEFGGRRDLAGLEERNKLVHGVSMAGMRAMVSILSPKGDLRLTPTAALWPETLGQFAQHLVRRAAWAQKGVKDVGEMEEFWQELLDGVKTGLFGTEWDEMRLYFHVRESEHGTGFAPNLPDQSYQLLTDGSAPVFPWTSYELAIADTVVYAKLEESVRRKGRSMKLRLPDIKSMLSGEPYWIPVQRGERVKFEKGSQGSHQFWRINLDAFEDLGYRAMADNDLVQWLKKAVDEFKREESTEGGALPHVVHEFGLSKEQLRVCFSQVSQDPRRGELFRIVEKWREHKMKNRQ